MSIFLDRGLEPRYSLRMMYRTNAAFYVLGKWVWVKWDHKEANKHKAILDKASEVNAESWDFGQADHAEVSRYPISR